MPAMQSSTISCNDATPIYSISKKHLIIKLGDQGICTKILFYCIFILNFVTEESYRASQVALRDSYETETQPKAQHKF